MREEIDVAGTEDETAAELKRIRAQAMLPMAGCGRARPGFRVVASKKMQQVRRLEAGRAIREPLRIDQQRKRDSGLLAKQAGVAGVAKTDSGEIGALGAEFIFMIAQLRNMLAAEDSTVMAEEHDDGGSTFPQRAEPDFALVGIGQRNLSEIMTERLDHRRNLTQSSENRQKKRRRKQRRFARNSRISFIHRNADLSTKAAFQNFALERSRTMLGAQ
jgi:hypothetical protein